MEIKLYRLTKPTTLGKFGVRIKELEQTLSDPTIIYEGLYMYFLHTVQASEYALSKGMKPMREFTLVTIDDQTVGLAHWRVKDIPLNIATAYMDFIYMWEDDPKAKEALIYRFIAFGRRNNCEFFQYDTDDEDVEKAFSDKNLTSVKKEFTSIIAFKGR
jgi:hypothetical protein